VKYSIVIPTYNHLEDCLKPCIESVLKFSDMSETEIIVVANGCKDGTREYLKSLKGRGVRYVWYNEGLGYTKAANIGIQQSEGEYVVLLNNDTVILDFAPKHEWLKALERPFEEDPKMGVVGPSILYFSPGHKETGLRYNRTDGDWFVVFFCAMIKKSTFDAIGLLDEIFSPGFGEDLDFCLRAKAKGYTIRQVPFDKEWEYQTEFPIYHRPESTFLDEEHRDRAHSWFIRGIEIVTRRWNEGEYAIK
jgi:O-antigen biosynthesis protein